MTKTEFAPDQGNGTYILSEETLLSYNRAFFENIEVACESRDYLEQIINSI